MLWAIWAVVNIVYDEIVRSHIEHNGDSNTASDWKQEKTLSSDIISLGSKKHGVANQCIGFEIIVIIVTLIIILLFTIRKKKWLTNSHINTQKKC